MFDYEYKHYFLNINILHWQKERVKKCFKSPNMPINDVIKNLPSTRLKSRKPYCTQYHVHFLKLILQHLNIDYGSLLLTSPVVHTFGFK